VAALGTTASLRASIGVRKAVRVRRSLSRFAHVLFWPAGSRQFLRDFPLGRKPMLIGLSVDTPVSTPDFLCPLANTVFQIAIHDGGLQ